MAYSLSSAGFEELSLSGSSSVSKYVLFNTGDKIATYRVAGHMSHVYATPTKRVDFKLYRTKDGAEDVIFQCSSNSTDLASVHDHHWVDFICDKNTDVSAEVVVESGYPTTYNFDGKVSVV